MNFIGEGLLNETVFLSGSGGNDLSDVTTGFNIAVGITSGAILGNLSGLENLAREGRINPKFISDFCN